MTLLAETVMRSERKRRKEGIATKQSRLRKAFRGWLQVALMIYESDCDNLVEEGGLLTWKG